MDLERERKVAAALTDNLYESIREGWTYMGVKEIWEHMKENHGRGGCWPSVRAKCDEVERCDEFVRSGNEQLAKDYYRQCRPVRLVLHLMLEEQSEEK